MVASFVPSLSSLSSSPNQNTAAQSKPGQNNPKLLTAAHRKTLESRRQTARISMLRAAAAASAIFPARFAAAPAVAAAAELRSPLLRVLGTLRGGRSSVLLGRRARFCTNSSDTEAAAAEAEAKAEDGTVAEGEADGKASSAIVPTNPQIEDCLSVRTLLVWIRVHLLSCLHQPFAWNCCKCGISSTLLPDCSSVLDSISGPDYNFVLKFTIQLECTQINTRTPLV